MNNLYSQLNPVKPSLNSNMANVIKMLKNSTDPMRMLNTLATNNPQIRSVMNLLQNNNQSPKDLFYSIAKQQGVDPEQIINMLK